MFISILLNIIFLINLSTDSKCLRWECVYYTSTKDYIWYITRLLFLCVKFTLNLSEFSFSCDIVRNREFHLHLYIQPQWCSKKTTAPDDLKLWNNIYLLSVRIHSFQTHRGNKWMHLWPYDTSTFTHKAIATISSYEKMNPM